MTYGWLSLPLLIGYVLVSFSPSLSYHHGYLDRQRLIFHASIVGGILMFISFLAVELLAVYSVGFDPYLSQCDLPSLAVVTLGSVVLGALILSVDWFRHQNNDELKREKLQAAVQRVGTPLEKLLVDAFFDQTTLQITLDNGKVYVGFVQSAPEPRLTEYVSITPLLSGYRDEK